MAMRVKTFLQILMIVMVLGINLPVNAGVPSSALIAKVCCCTGETGCLCPTEIPCSHDCQFTQASSASQQVVVASTTVPLLRIDLVLYSLVSGETTATDSFSASHIHENASPPLNGCQHQAILRLWLI